MKRREGVWLVEHMAKVPTFPGDQEWAARVSAGAFEYEFEALKAMSELPRGQMNYRHTYYVPTPIVATPKQPKPTVTRKVKRR